MSYEEDDEVPAEFPLTQAQCDGERASWPGCPAG